MILTHVTLIIQTTTVSLKTRAVLVHETARVSGVIEEIKVVSDATRVIYVSPSLANPRISVVPIKERSQGIIITV